LEKEYSVLSGNESIGIARVKRCGLYYHISCRCELSGEVPYKVIVSGNCGEADLGICVPKENSFGMEVRIPIKRIGEGPHAFQAVPRHGVSSGEFVPFCAEEPFRCLSRLSSAYLAKRNGQTGVMLQ